jgi:hypothetical protein
MKWMLSLFYKKIKIKKLKGAFANRKKIVRDTSLATTAGRKALGGGWVNPR